MDFWDQEILAGLCPQHMRFVRTYVETDDWREAVKAAWPESQAPNARFHEAMCNPKVKEALGIARAAVIQHMGMSRAAILRELEYLARFNPADYIGTDGRPVALATLPEEKARALGDMEFALLPDGTVIPVKNKTTKIEALKVLAKANGMLDKGAGEEKPTYNFDLHFGAEVSGKGVTVQAGGTTLDIKLSDG